MSKTYFVANWKMKCPGEGLESYFKALPASTSSQEIVVCPSFPFLQKAAQESAHRQFLCAQTCSSFESGAYTGDVSVAFLKDVGCQYILVGHSERRTHFYETNEDVAEKLKRVWEMDLTPILCVGETLEEREAGRHFSVMEDQLSVRGADNFMLIAYEPVWAIGTGRAATLEQIDEMHQRIAQRVPGVPVLYGGSVAPDTAHSILSLDSVQGVLVGGASLKSESFCQIIREKKAEK